MANSLGPDDKSKQSSIKSPGQLTRAAKELAIQVNGSLSHGFGDIRYAVMVSDRHAVQQQIERVLVAQRKCVYRFRSTFADADETVQSLQRI